MAPVAAVAPASRDFGTVNTGSTSAPLPITVTNNGNAPLSVSGVTLTGDPVAQFGFVGCGAVVNPGGSCIINVTFTPTTNGLKSATLSIAHNSNNVAGASTVGLTGTGSTAPVPVASVSPARWPSAR